MKKIIKIIINVCVRLSNNRERGESPEVVLDKIRVKTKNEHTKQKLNMKISLDSS